MNTETSQKMTYQEREALKGFTDKRALQGDTQSPDESPNDFGKNH